MKRSEIERPQNCACFNLRRAARKVTQAYDRALKPAGISATQFTLLAMLAQTDTGDGIAMIELAEWLGMDRTTLTRNLAVAERRKWVRVAIGEDRRERRVRLAPAGRSRLKMAWPYWTAAQQRLRDRLGGGALAELLTLTRQLGA